MLLVLMFAHPAEAARVPPGAGRLYTAEEIRFVADTSLRTRDGKEFYLGHRVELSKKFGLSFGIEDKGLVLAVKGERAYMLLPNGEQLRDLQQESLLPDPLPSVKLTKMGKLKGNSGWIVLVFRPKQI